MTLTPQQITSRLEQVEREVEEREVGGEKAAEDAARMRRRYELAYAQEFVKAQGSPMEKKQLALAAVALDKELWNDLISAEAGYEGWKAAMRSRELRTSIGQSLLKHQREMGG